MRTASWHCHHDTLCEWDSEPREVRIAYIKANKPPDQQELRLRLYRPMSIEATAELIAYDAAVKLARDAYEAAMKPARDAYALAVKPVRNAYALAVKSASDAYDLAVNSASNAYDLAVNSASNALEARHKLDCPNCPWDGKTIFPVDNAT